MAAPSSSSSDFTVVLFNCGHRPFQNPETRKWSNRPVINEDIRKKCVKQVMDRLPIGDECNLFLLVQDTISMAIHSCISDHVRRSTAGECNRQAGVYLFSPSHDVECLNRKYLEQVSARMTPASSKHLKLNRLTACVITQKRTRDKMLLVSWHGQYKVKDYVKARNYHALIDFLELLRQEKNCSSVMIGGDFNLSIDYAKQVLTQEKPELKGVVCDDYLIPSFRAGSHKIDYIVRWPARYYDQLGRADLIRPSFEPNKEDHVENPFGHPIIKFRFKAGTDTGQTEQRIDTLERHQKSRKEEVEELMKRFEEMNLRVNTLERQEEHHKQDVLEKDERITALETELEEREIEDLKRQIQQGHQDEEDLEENESDTDLETELEEWEYDDDDEGLEKDERIEALENELEEQERQILEKEERITALETELEEQKKHRRKEDEEKNKVIKTLQTKLAEQEEINKRELRKNEEKDQQVEDLNQQVEDLNQQVE